MNENTKKNKSLSLNEKEKLWHDDGIDYDWLIDRLEGEKNLRNKRAAYDFVLSSKGELDAYESLHHIRTILKTCDDVALPESGDYYRNMTDQIMGAVRNESRKKLRKEKLETLRKMTTQFVQKNSLTIINLMYFAMRR